jgi:CheY-like chemotaxis protein/nitrogen-specific signal transduction histidine kinase
MLFTIENPDLDIIEQLEKAKDEANRANRAKSDFLSSMSHEIRTPLNAIIGFSEFIIDTQDIEEAHSQAKDVVSASQTLLETVNGILDLSKVESGKLEIVNDNYNVRDLLDSTVKMAKARLGDKKLDLRVHFAEDLPDTLYGDKGNLNKVLINLLTNAIKYTNEGYIDYSVQCAKNNDTCRLFITVKDTGIGIKKENIDKLFTRFQRFDEKNNGTIEGTGLGLAITKQLVEMMGGNIVVSSIYGEGSSFSVALDQGLSSVHVESKQENTQETAEFNFHDKRILVVDDNNLNLKLADRIFAKYNCKPKLVNSGFECLDLVNAGEKFDLILLDDVMPKMLGSETLTRLKRIEDFDTPVVALTANAVSGMKEKYLLLGFDDYLAKPIERDQLSVILKKFLVNNTKAKKLDETQLTSSRPAELVTETVKENILNSASSKDVIIVEKENDKTKTITIEKKNEPEKTEVKEEVKETKEEVKETETKNEVKEDIKTSNNIKVSLPDSEEFTDYSGRRVLVVDDNKLNLKVALKFLSRYKFEEDEAYSGEECLNKIKSGEKYDIIFMDIMMPNMNGVETFHALQKIEGFNTPVVVALTADAVEGAQERYLGEGFAEYISKPIVRERLDKVIHEVLDGKE